MKLLRWAAAGASVYAVYRYSIGKKAKGEDVLVSQERAIADLTKSGGNGDAKEAKTASKPKSTRRKKASPPKDSPN